MSDTQKRDSAAATPKARPQLFTQITSVIYMGPWTLKDRIAAAAAFGIVSGVIFFFIWLYAGLRSGGPWPSLLWPGGATFIMAVIALIHPGWAEILYEKIFSDRD